MKRKLNLPNLTNLTSGVAWILLGIPPGIAGYFLADTLLPTPNQVGKAGTPISPMEAWSMTEFKLKDKTVTAYVFDGELVINLDTQRQLVITRATNEWAIYLVDGEKETDTVAILEITDNGRISALIDASVETQQYGER